MTSRGERPKPGGRAKRRGNAGARDGGRPARSRTRRRARERERQARDGGRVPRAVTVALWLLIADAIAQTSVTVAYLAGEDLGTILKTGAALVALLLFVAFLLATTAGGSGMSAALLSIFSCLLGGIAFAFPLVLMAVIGPPDRIPSGSELLPLVSVFGCGGLLLSAGVLLRLPSARRWYSPAGDDWSISQRWRSLAHRR